MNQIDIIAKKRDGKALTEAELDYVISGYVRGEIPDYQISALLMAIYLQGMSPSETATLTRLMRDSGVVMRHTKLSAAKVDKHSTGGVGDKVSLVLAPLVAAAGLIVPMISGRALGHTGGTLDKLEAIPGFRTQLDLKEIDKLLEDVGVAMVGQTDDLTPADKKVYSLRDATATVHSIPLITASILSKKMAEGIDALVLDVKVGQGAMFRDEHKARELAQMLVNTATEFNLNTAAILSGMEQPLGNAVGNWLETKEAIETLKGDGPPDFKELCLILSAQMLLLAGKTKTLAEGIEILENEIGSGAAYAKFLEIVERQGGDAKVVENPEGYPTARFQHEIKSPNDGYVTQIQAREIGEISMFLGAGRKSVDDKIDYTAGILLLKKVGDAVKNGETLATAFSSDENQLKQVEGRLQAAFEVGEQAASAPPLILGLVDSEGKKQWDSQSREFS